MTPPRPGIAIIEDDALLSEELRLLIIDTNEFEPFVANDYRSALRLVEGGGIDGCILDLDLGSALREQAPLLGEDGRRILGLLGARHIPTVVYSGHLADQGNLRQLHRTCVPLSKGTPATRVLTALRDLLPR